MRYEARSYQRAVWLFDNQPDCGLVWCISANIERACRSKSEAADFFLRYGEEPLQEDSE